MNRCMPPLPLLPLCSCSPRRWCAADSETVPLIKLPTFSFLSLELQLFPEEVVRGGPAFAVSLVLTSIEPRMRAAAELGAWQVRQASEALTGTGRGTGTCLLACSAARPHQAAVGQPPLISAAGFLPSCTRPRITCLCLLLSSPRSPFPLQLAHQIISPNAAFGRLEIVTDLHSIQEKVGGC